MLRTGAVGTLIVVQMLSATYASAKSPGDARAEAELRRGHALMQKRDYAGALAIFERAERIDPAPRVRAQIALAKLALGRLADAETDLAAVLKEDADDWVQRNHPVLQASLDRIQDQLGSLEVTGTPAGATVHVDGAPAATIPTVRPLRLKPGPLSFTVTHPGFASIAKATEIGARETTFERIALVPLVRVSTPSAVAPTTNPTTLSRTTTTRPDDTGHLRTGCWISLAVGAALALASVPFFVEDASSLPGALLAGTGAGTMIVGGGLLLTMPW